MRDDVLVLSAVATLRVANSKSQILASYLRKQYVERLQVAVDNIVVVKVCQTRYDILINVDFPVPKSVFRCPRRHVVIRVRDSG